MTTTPAHEADLRFYLQDARNAVLLKVDGLSEYDVRRPLTPTGTNLLGLVKHLAGAEAMYFGETFGRPFSGAPLLWVTGAAEEANSDLWARADESREGIVDTYRRACAHADETIASLPLDAVGRIPFEPYSEIPLHRLIVHMIGETHRHAGHADIVRELIDGAVGLRGSGDNLPSEDGSWWARHRERVERAAREASADGHTFSSNG
ncbi:DinB family protein [Streptomyces sp. NPDC047072]|uniref:DinB family protein n=1 Tax=Streptomyces sp. NPDC047072 TaxID=3154809 RepID=UPI0033DFA167